MGQTSLRCLGCHRRRSVGSSDIVTGCSGKRTPNVVPVPAADITSTCPLNASTADCTTDRPSPNRDGFVEKNGSNIRSRSDAGMPAPKSLTVSRATGFESVPSGSTAVVTRMSELGGDASNAFHIALTDTWATASGATLLHSAKVECEDCSSRRGSRLSSMVLRSSRVAS